MIISKKFSFEAAHMLSDYKGPCANLHGHSYTGEVFIEGKPGDTSGMILDYNEIKNIINNFDHAIIFSACLVWNTAEEELCEWACKHGMKIYVLGKKCTAENIALEIRRVFFNYLPDTNIRVILKETSSSEVDTGWLK